MMVYTLEKKIGMYYLNGFQIRQLLNFMKVEINPFDLEKVSEVFYDSMDDTVKCMIEFDVKELSNSMDILMKIRL
ncbi:hypothetical protein [Aquibacillus rhizosphaerae]|uniref:hypothetical protein n=1 Tax=Aquibacillus rhizosphaerae TaxID=3051431 RepID=UPI002F412326